MTIARVYYSLMNSPNPIEIATLAGGCFWCLEAVYQEAVGVLKVVSGYIGGHTSDPTYDEVCDGSTGHAEAVQISFDPARISYPDILRVFFTIHDPTTLNRQGNDAGTQYRSAIYFHSPEQENFARQILAEFSPHFDDPIVTELTPASTFWPAEAYHQNYFRSHPHQPYCLFAIPPKLRKFREKLARLHAG
jgi:peptide-methionine (S)-S-oxide reductase